MMKLVDTYYQLYMGELVEIVNLGGDQLEGKMGWLVGISSHVGGMICWIVKLAKEEWIKEYGCYVQSIVMPSVCLIRVCEG